MKEIKMQQREKEIQDFPPSLRDGGEMHKFLFQFESFLKNHLRTFSCLPFKGHQQLKEAIEYSLLSGGKYFRPLLIFATAKLLSLRHNVIPWASAIEMLHSASLIHDDLPCMDNSFQRRKKASCHRRFGENMALLAGDSLWIEAFRLIGIYETKEKSGALLSVLSEAAGFNGLMGGQALDLKTPPHPDKFYYEKMHSMKTGALIAAGMEGVLKLSQSRDFPVFSKKRTTLRKINNISEEKAQKVRTVGLLIGQAFQLSDDLQDVHNTTEKEASNFVYTLGEKKARNLLNELSEKALRLIDFEESHFLKELIIFNQKRPGAKPKTERGLKKKQDL